MWGGFQFNSRGLGRGRFIPTRVGRFFTEPSTKSKSPVHPHACGAVMAGTGSGMVGCGSSPRVWGGFDILFAVPGGERFIPTRVGRLNQMINAFLNNPVHPHACGAVKKGKKSGKSLDGSSPRVWGG